MTHIVTRYYVSQLVCGRFLEALYGLEDINSRILDVVIKGVFCRYVVAVTEEEQTILALVLDPNECYITSSTTLLDRAIDLMNKKI